MKSNGSTNIMQNIVSLYGDNDFFEVEFTEKEVGSFLAVGEVSVLVKDLHLSCRGNHSTYTYKKPQTNYTPPNYSSNTTSFNNNSSRRSYNLTSWTDAECVINPPNNTIIESSKSISLSFVNKLSISEEHAWDILCSDGVEVRIVSHRSRLTSNSQQKLVQRYELKLSPYKSNGVVQFIQRSKSGVISSFGKYPYGSIINVFVFQPASYVSTRHFDCLINAKQTFISTNSMCDPQLIISNEFAVSQLLPSANTLYDLVSVKKSFSTDHSIYKFRKPRFNSVPQILLLKSRYGDSNASVILTDIEYSANCYTVINQPIDGILDVFYNAFDQQIKTKSHGVKFITNKKIPLHSATHIDKTKVLKIVAVNESFSLDQNKTYQYSALINDYTGFLRISNLYDNPICTT